MDPFEPQQPVSHAVGLPALRQFQGTGSRLAPGSYVVIARVSVEVAAQATDFVLEPLAHGDAECIEMVVTDLDLLRCVDDNESFRCRQTCHQTSEEGHRHWCAVDLSKTQNTFSFL